MSSLCVKLRIPLAKAFFVNRTRQIANAAKLQQFRATVEAAAAAQAVQRKYLQQPQLEQQQEQQYILSSTPQEQQQQQRQQRGRFKNYHSIIQKMKELQNYQNYDEDEQLEQEEHLNDAITLGGQRILAVFDFDLTTITKDSDTVISKMLTTPQLKDDSLAIIKNHGSLYFMDLILQMLHKQLSCQSAGCIRRQVRCIPPVPGMIWLLHKLGANHAVDIIMVSDANSFSINEWLKAYNLRRYFSALFTNVGKVMPNGRLCLRPYMQQMECTFCPYNLCKGIVLNELIAQHGLTYKHIIYVGDGKNDLCAVLHMRREDIACPRHGFKLEQLLNSTAASCIMPKIIPWSNGYELYEQLNKELCLDGNGV